MTRPAFMEVQPGTPVSTGRYACYMKGDPLASVVRIWLIGHGWFNNLQEPVEGEIVGWIGPLPMNKPAPPKPEPAPKAPPEMEFDL